jgi:glycosyltransferase involved in cell wall biosynthesis
VGWNWVSEVRRDYDIWVLAPESERGPVEDYLKRQSLPNVHFHFCDLPPLLVRRGYGLHYLHYRLWQVVAYMAARRLHREHAFDVTHHLTLGMHWAPSLLACLPVPFLWGPLGGGERAPAAFDSSFTFRGRVYERVRDLARTLGEFDPLVRITARRAVLALAKSQQTAARLAAIGARSVIVFPEAALPQEELHRLGQIPPPGDRFRLLTLGRLIHWKGPDLALRAFARFHQEFPDSEYWLAGEGPERARLERRASDLGVASSVVFLGQLKRAQALEKLAQSSALVHPSLHDSGGWVCLEAMAAGRPVVCLDIGGPALQVTAETGIKVAASSPAQAVRDLASAFTTLATDPELVCRMGQAGRRHVRQSFSWNGRTEALCRLYEEVLGEPKRRPMHAGAES